MVISKRKQTFYTGNRAGGGEEEVLRGVGAVAQIEGLASWRKGQACKAHFNMGAGWEKGKENFSAIKMGAMFLCWSCLPWICLYRPYKLRQHDFVSLLHMPHCILMIFLPCLGPRGSSGGQQESSRPPFLNRERNPVECNCFFCSTPALGRWAEKRGVS